MIFSIVSSGVGLVGGNVSSNLASMALAVMPFTSSRLSVLWEVGVCMFKESRHTCPTCVGKLRGFTLIHQAVAGIQPKFFVQIFIGSIFT
jgi:hypothetical protein